MTPSNGAASAPAGRRRDGKIDGLSSKDEGRLERESSPALPRDDAFEPPAPEGEPSVSADDSPPERRPYGLIVGLQVLVLLGVSGLGFVVFESRTMLLETRSELERIEGLAQETARIAQEHESLREEIVNLRGYVASRTTEDVIFLKIMIAKPRLEHDTAREIAQHVRHYAGVYGQDPDLVLAMIDIESDFDPTIVSHMGAVGLMQVMPQWKRVLGIDEDLRDIETSIKYGLQILGFYREMYKDLEVALTAYNRGPGAVDAALMKGRDPKNKYAPRVLERYAYFRALNTPPS